MLGGVPQGTRKPWQPGLPRARVRAWGGDSLYTCMAFACVMVCTHVQL